MFHFRMAKNQTRRNFLRAAPLAAAVSIPLTDMLLFASNAASGEGQPAATETFQLITAEKLADAIKSSDADPGEHYLYQPKTLPVTIALTSEGKKTGKDFEYHEGRDHIFLILEGAATFELGGKPKDARNTKPGEWLAPSSEGATTVVVKKGDILLVPRGTPHRQSAEESATWMLISTTGSAKT